MKIFTWHIHGSYLYYLSQGDFTIYIPVRDQKTEGYYGRGETFPFGDNVIEVPFNEVRYLQFDCVLYQTKQNYITDKYAVLSDEQQQLPSIYLEHDTPREHAVNTKHIVTDRNVTLVHVTHYNKLMWNNNDLQAEVIEHGVCSSSVSYRGDIERGIVVINNLPKRGRLLGLDLLIEARKYVPIDLVGMGTGDLGLGEVLHPQLPEFLSHYRFYFHPVRYTSLGLSVLESMMLGMPVVGLATTELPTVITNNVSGFIHTDFNYLVKKMRLLLDDKNLAATLGEAAKKTAIEKFNIKRFTADWERLFYKVTSAAKPVLVQEGIE